MIFSPETSEDFLPLSSNPLRTLQEKAASIENEVKLLHFADGGRESF